MILVTYEWTTAPKAHVKQFSRKRFRQNLVQNKCLFTNIMYLCTKITSIEDKKLKNISNLNIV
jgi:hypothetical protein